MSKNPRASIKRLQINRLRGRLLEFSAVKKADDNRTIILVYGQHASLERVWGIADYLSQFGRVLAPDLPGFGGMTPFRARGQKPDLDNYARYLAAFIDRQLKPDQSIQIIGISFGFWIVTRLLQIRPDLANRCHLVASLVGFVDSRSVKFSFWRRHFYSQAAGLLQNPLIARLFGWFCSPTWWLGLAYKHTPLWKNKMSGSDPNQRQKLIDFELNLWRINDTATWAATARHMLTQNLRGQPKIRTRLLHVATSSDQYIDPSKNRQSLEAVYDQVNIVTVSAPAHAPPLIIDAKQAAAMLPADFGQRLRQSFE